MTDSSTMDCFTLDILGQMPSFFKLYTQISCIFPVADPSLHGSVTKILRNGLDRLAESLPWLAGEVINEGASEGNSGSYRIVPSERIPLVVKDLRDVDSTPTMDAMRKACFPFTMLDENSIAPCATLNIPGTSVGLAVNSSPVFAVQVSFVAEGCILTIVGQHNAMDMTGQGSIIRLLSKACYGEPFTPDELSVGNTDRSKSVTLFDNDSYRPGPELSHQLVQPQDESKEEASAPCTWAYLKFSASSLKALKSLAAASVEPSSEFVSTDDAVTAFIWQRVTKARIPRLEYGGETTLSRAVDVRKCMGVSPDYPGMLQNLTLITDTTQRLVDAPLGLVASRLRSKLNPEPLAFTTRSLMTYLANSPDKTKAQFTATIDPSSDLMLSSWAKVDLYDLDFNLGLGKPEAVCRPHFTLVESLAYLMPKSPQGELVAGICLRDEDWEWLMSDEEFTRYATYIG